MSTRYEAIVALLDDPANQACVMREMQRRQKRPLKILPPPVPRDGGGWVFPTLRESMRHRPQHYAMGVDVDAVYEIFSDGKGWFVYLTAVDSEIGPFDDAPTALREAKLQAEGDGYTLLDKMPWNERDIEEFSL